MVIFGTVCIFYVVKYAVVFNNSQMGMNYIIKTLLSIFFMVNGVLAVLPYYLVAGGMGCEPSGCPSIFVEIWYDFLTFLIVLSPTLIVLGVLKIIQLFKS